MMSKGTNPSNSQRPFHAGLTVLSRRLRNFDVVEQS